MALIRNGHALVKVRKHLASGESPGGAARAFGSGFHTVFTCCRTPSGDRLVICRRCPLCLISLLLRGAGPGNRAGRVKEVAREWRNGRRAGFRCQCPKGRGGSNPPSRTQMKESRSSDRGSFAFPAPKPGVCRIAAAFGLRTGARTSHPRVRWCRVRWRVLRRLPGTTTAAGRLSGGARGSLEPAS